LTQFISFTSSVVASWQLVPIDDEASVNTRMNPGVKAWSLTTNGGVAGEVGQAVKALPVPDENVLKQKGDYPRINQTGTDIMPFILDLLWDHSPAAIWPLWPDTRRARDAGGRVPALHQR
jgi:hypothetical protein